MTFQEIAERLTALVYQSTARDDDGARELVRVQTTAALRLIEWARCYRPATNDERNDFAAWVRQIAPDSIPAQGKERESLLLVTWWAACEWLRRNHPECFLDGTPAGHVETDTGKATVTAHTESTWRTRALETRGALRCVSVVLAEARRTKRASRRKPAKRKRVADVLTGKQHEVAEFRGQGYSIGEIAHKLGISRQAVHKRLAAARAKLEAHTKIRSVNLRNAKPLHAGTRPGKR